MNPSAGAGKTHQSRDFILNKIEKYLGKEFTLWVTTRPAEAASHAIKAVESGGELLIAVGGDGTIHEVVNGIFSASDKSEAKCTLGIISSGTGQDYAKSLGLPLNIDEQLEVINKGHTEYVDVGKIIMKNKNEEAEIKYFINEFQVGIGGEVVRKVNANSKHKGGLLTYGLATVSLLFKYSGNLIKAVIDENEILTDKFIGFILANGNCMGGGMRLSSSIRLNDHLFDLLIVPQRTAIQKFINFPKIYSGKLKDSKLIGYRTIKKLLLESDEEVLVGADGELLGTLPCEVTLLPSVLKVCADFSK